MRGVNCRMMHKKIDALSGGYVSKVLQHGDLEGKLESTLMLHQVPGVQADRILLVGLGKKTEFKEKQYCKAVRASVKALSTISADEVLIMLAELSVGEMTTRKKVSHLVETALDATYRFEAIKRKQEASEEKESKKGIKVLNIQIADATDLAEAKSGLVDGKAIGDGVSLTKDLGNLPPNVCTPTYLAEQAQALAKTYGLTVEVLEREAMQKLGMGSFLGVAQGSEEPPKLIVLQHLKGHQDQKPVVLVGKGITFDTGVFH